jgi:imidazolonepropionase-like amidohydrolase
MKEDTMLRPTARLGVAALGVVLLALAVPPPRTAAQAPAAGGATALAGVRIIDGTGAAPVENGTIVIRDGRIAAAGASVQVPAGATRVDLAGKTVMPGMVNAHGHVQNQTKSMPVRDDLTRRLRTYASYGVTTVVSLGQTTLDEEAEVIRLRDEQDRGTLDRARVYTSGPSIRNQKTVEEVRQTVDQYVLRKVDRMRPRGPGAPARDDGRGAHLLPEGSRDDGGPRRGRDRAQRARR